MAIKFDRSKAPKPTERRKYDWKKFFNGRQHFIPVDEVSASFGISAKNRFAALLRDDETTYEKVVIFKVVVDGEEADLPKEGEEATHWCLWVE